MKSAKIVSAATVAVLALSGYGVTYTYSDHEAQRTLNVNVAKDETAYFDPSQFSPAGATVTNITKVGEGTLWLRNAECSGFADKTFDVVIKNGIFAIENGNCVGKSSPVANSIYVENGGTFQNGGGGGNCALGNAKVYAQGRGYAEKGALMATSYEWSAPFGALTLLGDTKMVNTGSGGTIFHSGNYNGHDVEFDVSYAAGTEWSTFTDVGNLLVVGKNGSATLAMKKWVNFDGNPEKTITFTNVVFALGNALDTSSERGLRFLSQGRGFVSGLRFQAGSSLLINSAMIDNYARNTWRGPVSIDCAALNINVPANGTLHEVAFTNRVTGGGIALNGLDTTQLGLYLCSNESSFTGGVHGAYANLHLVHGQALPAGASAGTLVLTNSTLTLESQDDTYVLPASEFVGDSVVTGGVHGAFASLKKSGTGELVYKTMVGAAELEVAGGSVDLTQFKNQSNRSSVSGLIEGFIDNSATAAGANNDSDYSFANRYVWTVNRTVEMPSNTVVRGLSRLYLPYGAGHGGINSNCVYHCTGYVWNNSETNETWAFATPIAAGFDWRIDLNDEMVVCEGLWFGSWIRGPLGFINNAVAGDDLARMLLTLRPGANKFSFTMFARHGNSEFLRGAWHINGYGSYRSSYSGDSYEYWKDDCLFMFNRTGNASRNINDYEKLMDPGDGSLFTWAIPDEKGLAVNPLTEEEVDPPALKIAKAKFAANTVAKTGANEWWFDTLEGWPTFDGTGDVLVKNKFIVDCDDAGTASFALPGKLTFAEGATIEFKYTGDKVPRALRNRVATLGTAAGGIVGKPVCAAEHWAVRVEGNALKAVCATPSCVLIVK